MSRREYPVADRYEERESEFYRRPRHERDYEELEVDVSRSRFPEGRRTETIVRERDSGPSERRPRQPDFLREDYAKSNAGQLVIREESRREEDNYSSSRRSRAPTERIERDEYVLRERDRSDRGGLPYPRSQRSELEFKEVDREETISRRARSRPPPSERGGPSKEEIDITIRRNESERQSQPPPPAPRSEVRERDIEEITFRRGPGERPGVRLVEREEIDIRESRSPAPRPRSTIGNKEELEIDIRDVRRSGRDREINKEEISIRERSVPPPRQRSASRGALVARKEEEWVVRRPRSPPPKDVVKQEIIIRRTEPEPEPPREPTPEPSPPPPPPLEPIYRPPIIQEVITHHRHFDHGIERVRAPSPSPSPPPPPPPAREENLEIEIKRKGFRNGHSFEEDIIIDRETIDKGGREREPDRERERNLERDRILEREREHDIDIDLSLARRRSRSRARSVAYRDVNEEDDDVAAEAEYYNRKIASRGYPGEAYNGATKDWALVDVPPGTERVRMDGVGGGSQEITWQRYNGERRGRFVSGDRVYDGEFANSALAPPPPAPAPPPPAPAPPAPPAAREFSEEIKITETRTESRPPPAPAPAPRRKRERMWTEVAKDLVIREAIEEMGYACEETEEYFYVIEYLRYEDVLRLVEITEDIRRERAERIRELQWERERAERERERERADRERERERAERERERARSSIGSGGGYEERIVEREYIIDRDRGRRYR